MRRLNLLVLVLCTLACGTDVSEPNRADELAAVRRTSQVDTLNVNGEHPLDAAALDARSPGRVTDLRVDSTTENSVTLRFTEMGDGAGRGANYDVRYSRAADSLAWGSAASVESGTCRTPVAGGSVSSGRTCTVTGLESEETYRFQLVTFRGTLGVSAVFGGLSNVATGATTAPPPPIAVTAPSIVTDLRVVSTTENGVTLRFTEVSDGAGQVASYDVRYSLAADSLAWGSATSVPAGTCRTPVAGGSVSAERTCTVTGLESEQAYRFQLVTFRGTLGVSAVFGGISNVATGTTTAPPPPIAVTAPSTVTDLRVVSTTENGATLRFTEVSDGAGRVANYDVRYFLAADSPAWGSATSVASGTCRTPVAGGSVSAGRTCTVTGLESERAYGFQLVTFRGALGVSAVFGGISNVATGTTSRVVLPTPDPTPTPTPQADIIFFDDFESGSLDNWDDGVNASRHRVVTNAGMASSGNRYLDITFPAGGTGGWMTKFFMPGYDSLYVRYDVRVNSDWTSGTKLLNLRGAPINNQWGAHGNSGRCPTGYDFFAANIVLMPDQGPGPARFYTYYPGMRPEPSGICWGRLTGEGDVHYFDGPGLTKGEWHTVEFWVKLNDPLLRNGAQRLWIDGTLRGEWTDMTFRLTDALKLNSLTLEASLMGPGTSYTRHLLVDNLLVTRGRPRN